jgi:hypothetical protein
MLYYMIVFSAQINPLNAELNAICHLLALLGAHYILHVSRVRVNDGSVLENRKKLQNQYLF